VIPDACWMQIFAESQLIPGHNNNAQFCNAGNLGMIIHIIQKPKERIQLYRAKTYGQNSIVYC
jgi:hypothetical protein